MNVMDKEIKTHSSPSRKILFNANLYLPAYYLEAGERLSLSMSLSGSVSRYSRFEVIWILVRYGTPSRYSILAGTGAGSGHSRVVR